MAWVRMTSLRRAKNGDWFSRKGIPEDIREAYKGSFGVSQEARFRRPASTIPEIAKQQFRDWDAGITSRIARLRAKVRGEGEPTLTHRQSHALAGEWYSWFVAQHEEEPGSPEEWWLTYEMFQDEIATIVSRGAGAPDDDLDDAPRTPTAQRRVHRVLDKHSRVDDFLHERGIVLSDGAKESLLNAVEGEFVPALALLRRRAQGDYARDERPQKFPALPASMPRKAEEGVKPSGLTVWSVFELWIDGRKPAASTVNRWRAVFGLAS